jgi:hypothetical protein
MAHMVEVGPHHMAQNLDRVVGALSASIMAFLTDFFF